MSAGDFVQARQDVAAVLRVQNWGENLDAAGRGMLADAYIEFLQDSDECPGGVSAGEWLTVTRNQYGGNLSLFVETQRCA